MVYNKKAFNKILLVLLAVVTLVMFDTITNNDIVDFYGVEIFIDD